MYSGPGGGAYAGPGGGGPSQGQTPIGSCRTSTGRGAGDHAGEGRAGHDNRAEAPATIVQTQPRNGSKGGGWVDDGAPSDPEMRAVLLRMMRGRPSE
jgi:hypothetical protein